MNDINQQLAAIGEEMRAEPVEVEPVEVEPVEVEPVEVEPVEVEPAEPVEDPNLPTNVSSLAEAIGWTADELYDIDVSMGDGKDPIKLGALKDRYEQVVKKEQLATAEVDRLKSIDMGQPQQISQELMNAQAQVMSIQQQYQGYDWLKAEQEDPGQAALLKQKFTEAFAQANGAVQQVQQVQQQQQQANLVQGEARLLELIPEWSNTTKRQTDQASVKALMAEAGYPTEFINGISDPIAISLLNELVTLRAEKKAAVGAVKRVRSAPKVIKGVTKPTSTTNQTTLANKARMSGKRTDQVEAVKALFR